MSKTQISVIAGRGKCCEVKDCAERRNKLRKGVTAGDETVLRGEVLRREYKQVANKRNLSGVENCEGKVLCQKEKQVAKRRNLRCKREF